MLALAGCMRVAGWVGRDQMRWGTEWCVVRAPPILICSWDAFFRGCWLLFRLRPSEDNSFRTIGLGIKDWRLGCNQERRWVMWHPILYSFWPSPTLTEHPPPPFHQAGLSSATVLVCASHNCNTSVTYCWFLGSWNFFLQSTRPLAISQLLATGGFLQLLLSISCLVLWSDYIFFFVSFFGGRSTEVPDPDPVEQAAMWAVTMNLVILTL